MGWFTSLFTSDSSNSRRGQAMSSTHEAFSLPTSSPILGPHPDAFNPEMLQTPEPESATASSFAYPPQRNSVGPYGYVPTSSGSRSRPASLLPLHSHDHAPLSPSLPYPPLAQSWNRLRTWLMREYPELGDTLNYGILPQDLVQIEMQFGFALPAVVRESYLACDGQEAESAAGCSEGLFFGLTLLPLEDVLEEWRFWRDVDEDPTTGANERLREAMSSIPSGWVRKEYSQRGWIPLITDKAGNYIGVDLNPGEGGAAGQVIVFGRDFDTKVVMWRGDGPAGWAKWLASFVEELESGEGYELGSGNESEGSEDDVGYESYFYDGTGRGSGDGGGDTGTGGLKMTGEYKGWNVLEAWADRSVRRWHEAGIIPDLSLPPPDEEKAKKIDKIALGAIDFASTSAGGAEVAIPVLPDGVDSLASPITKPPPALGNVTNTAQRPLGPVPAISVTKAPAPLPVGVPTSHDINALPSPPESVHSDEEDVEARAGMRQVHREQDAMLTQARRSPKARSDTNSSSTPTTTVPVEKDAPLVPISPEPEATRPEIPDLLGSDPLGMGAAPITPSSPSPTREQPPADAPPEPKAEDVVPEPVAVPEPPPAPEVDGVSKTEPAAEVEAKAETDDADPDTTVRLVGGGGTSGLIDGDAPATEEPEEADNADTASVTSAASVDSASAPGKKHVKNKKSLSSGLKKLTKRKKASSSNLKEAAGAA